MGRGKVVLKKIKSSTSHQTAFSNRHAGLSRNLMSFQFYATLIDVALISFSSGGKLYHLASQNRKLKNYGVTYN
jgi:SRF-type transcription factor (DNA-binding and dimerisation domain)